MNSVVTYFNSMNHEMISVSMNSLRMWQTPCTVSQTARYHLKLCFVVNRSLPSGSDYGCLKASLHERSGSLLPFLRTYHAYGRFPNLEQCGIARPGNEILP
jgi:hypothetical protein